MHTHGRFSAKFGEPPEIIAYFRHPALSFERIIRFLIDTGAQRTFISPDIQDEMQIPSELFQEYNIPQITVNGLVYVNILPNCSLTFKVHTDDDDGNGDKRVCTIPNLGFAFLRDRSNFPKSRRIIPNLLGRDVLHKLSLGYCREHDYIFVTSRNSVYYKTLQTEFPSP